MPALWREVGGQRRRAGSIRPETYQYAAADLYRSRTNVWAELRGDGWYRLTRDEARARMMAVAPAAVERWFPPIVEGRDVRVLLWMPAELAERVGKRAAEAFGGNRTRCILAILDAATREG